MSDITDQDRRKALAWAGGSQAIGIADAAARVILAIVDAPEPTLAEELRDLGSLLEDEGGAGAKSTCWARDLATRAEKIEEERDYWKGYALDRQREVERLTAERDDRPATDLPDPAGVPAGEAWMVEVDGKRRTAVKYRERGWVYPHSGGYMDDSGKGMVLVSRLVPAPRQVTTWEELDALALYTVIRGANGAVCEKGRRRPGCAPQWFQVGIDESESAMITLPATVLYAPEVTA